MKTMFIMRGLPDSGKSTLADILARGGCAFAADDFFLQKGDAYIWNARKTAPAHAWNRGRCVEAMKYGVSPIVVDNTNVRLWHMESYIEIAMRFRYRVAIIELAHSGYIATLESYTERNIHSVPFEEIVRQQESWEDLPKTWSFPCFSFKCKQGTFQAEAEVQAMKSWIKEYNLL